MGRLVEVGLVGIVGVSLSGCVRAVVLRARAGGANARVAMRCGVERDAEVKIRGEQERYCGLYANDVGMVVSCRIRLRDWNPSKGQSRVVVVRWHRIDPESNSRRCAEIQSDSSFLGSTPSPSVVDVRTTESN